MTHFVPATYHRHVGRDAARGAAGEQEVYERRIMAPFGGFEKIVRQGEPLAMHTWFQLGGAAEFFAEPTNLDELVGLVRRCHEQEIPLRVLGGGSNILVRDEGVPGLVLQLAASAFGELEVERNVITAGAGLRLGRVVTTAAHAGLAGLEALIAIPGTLGGALRANVGTHGGDVGQWGLRGDGTHQVGGCGRPPA